MIILHLLNNDFSHYKSNIKIICVNNNTNSHYSLFLCPAVKNFTPCTYLRFNSQKVACTSVPLLLQSFSNGLMSKILSQFSDRKIFFPSSGSDSKYASNRLASSSVSEIGTRPPSTKCHPLKSESSTSRSGTSRKIQASFSPGLPLDHLSFLRSGFLLFPN